MHYTLLVVDSAGPERAHLLRLLEANPTSCTIYTAACGTGANALARKYTPDLILLNLSRCGTRTLTTLKQDAATRDIPVLALASTSATNLLHEAFEAGAIDYIPTPVHEVDVCARIKAALQTNLKTNTQHQEVVQQAATLQNINQELETFIYRSSHDLKSPLSSTKGLINVAQLQVQDSEARKYFEMMGESIGRMDQILDDLTQVALIKQGKVELAPIDFEREVTGILDSLAHLPNTTVEYTIDNQLDQPFLCDKRLLLLILQNLIENSIKYRKSEAAPAHLHIAIDHALDNMTRIVVRDQGMGISSTAREKVFDMFFRGTQASKGSGLGLYLVKNAVDKLAGKIEVQSVENQGSEFTVLLPDSES